MQRLILTCTILVYTWVVYDQAAWSQTLDIRAAGPFSPVTINHQKSLYYELYVTNSSSAPVTLKRLEVLRASDSIEVAVFNRAELEKRMGLVGTMPPSNRTLIAVGGTSIIYIEMALTDKRPGGAMIHRIDGDLHTSSGRKNFTEWGGTISVSVKPPVTLGAPLRAGPWVAVYSPDWERGHRRVVYTVGGKARIPGRFAIDFIKLDAQGKMTHADQNLIGNWYSYGEDVLAVADGTVDAIRDDFPESPTLSDHPRYPPDKATGNYVSLSIRADQVVFYEHLKPGSIRVKPGQTVRKGDVIASVGFTGQTTGPHLHLHVADANSPLGAEGLPFAFERFSLLGSYPNFDDFGKVLWKAISPKPVRITWERPAPNTVVEF